MTVGYALGMVEAEKNARRGRIVTPSGVLPLGLHRPKHPECRGLRPAGSQGLSFPPRNEPPGRRPPGPGLRLAPPIPSRCRTEDEAGRWPAVSGGVWSQRQAVEGEKRPFSSTAVSPPLPPLTLSFFSF